MLNLLDKAPYMGKQLEGKKKPLLFNNRISSQHASSEALKQKGLKSSAEVQKAGLSNRNKEIALSLYTALSRSPAL